MPQFEVLSIKWTWAGRLQPPYRQYGHTAPWGGRRREGKADKRQGEWARTIRATGFSASSACWLEIQVNEKGCRPTYSQSIGFSTAIPILVLLFIIIESKGAISFLFIA